MSSLNPEDRHRARELALQWLYQWEVGRVELADLFQPGQRVQLLPADAARDALAEQLVRGTAANLERIDPLIADATEHWRLERLAVIDRLVLRLASYELMFAPETPPPVVIDEACELARTFSSEQAIPFVNGVLDAVRKRLHEDPPAAS